MVRKPQKNLIELGVKEKKHVFKTHAGEIFDQFENAGKVQEVSNDLTRDVPSTRKTSSIQVRLIKCGREKCKCRSGKPEDMHGPYKYALVNQKWKYVGKP